MLFVWLIFIAIAAIYPRVTVSRKKNIWLAFWNFPPLCCWCLLSVKGSFEPSSLNSSLLLWPNASLLWLNACLRRCFGALARLKHQLKRTRVETNVPRKLTITARTIFSPPHKAQMVSEGESQGRHLGIPRHRGGFTRKHDRRARTANSLASWTDKDVCQRPCAITFGPHRRCPLWKRVWSPTCPLNGSFQSPNCPLKGFFHSPNGIF